MVRRACPLPGRGLGGADIHAAVDLRRVDAHHLEGEAARELERHRGLAARGGTQEQYRLHRPRMKRRSRSVMPNWYQVGRPWLQLPARSVCSICRRSAFISATVSERLARTAAWHAMVERS